MPYTKKYKKLLEATEGFYTGKKVPKKYQKKYGKRYSRKEARSIAFAIAKSRGFKT
jgi:hypothetical protein